MDAQFIHKTMRQGSILQKILRGKWIPSRKNFEQPQYIFVYQTYIQCYLSILNSKGLDNLSLLFEQEFYGKVSCACPGPILDNLNSFFAVYPKYVILYAFNHNENHFVCRMRINLDRLLINPDFIYYDFKHSELFLSCAHGGLGKYKIDLMNMQSQCVIAKKETGAVLTAYITNDDPYLVRIEGDQMLKIYELCYLNVYSSCSLKFDPSYGHVYLSFPYLSGITFIFSENILMFTPIPDINMSFLQTIKLQEIADSRIIDWCPYEDETVLLLSENSKIYHLNTDWLMIPRPEFENKYAINTKMIKQLDESAFLMISNGYAVLALKEKIALLPGFHPWQKGMVLQNYKLHKTPQFITYTPNGLALNFIGIMNSPIKKIDLRLEPDINDFFDSVHSNTTNYIAFSKGEQSKLFQFDEAKNDQVPVDRAVGESFRQNVATIGFGVLVLDKEILVQATKKVIYLIYKDGTPPKEIKAPLDADFVAFDSTNTQLIALLSNDKLKYMYVSNGTLVPVEFEIFSNGMDSRPYQDPKVKRHCAFSFTCESSPRAKYLAIAYYNRICVYMMDSFDSITHIDYVIPEMLVTKVDCVITSICWAGENYLVVGFRHGIVVIFRVDINQQKIIEVLNFSLGTGPTKVKNLMSEKINDKIQSFICTASSMRGTKIRVKEDDISVTPIYMHSFTHFAKGRPMAFFSLSDRKLSYERIRTREIEIQTNQILLKPFNFDQQIQHYQQQMRKCSEQKQQIQMQMQMQMQNPKILRQIQKLNHQINQGQQSLIQLQQLAMQQQIPSIIKIDQNHFQDSLFFTTPSCIYAMELSNKMLDANANDNIMPIIIVKPNERIISSAIARSIKDNNENAIVATVHTSDNQYSIRTAFLNNSIMIVTKTSLPYKAVAAVYLNRIFIFAATETTIGVFTSFTTQKPSIDCIARADNVGTKITSICACYDYSFPNDKAFREHSDMINTMFFVGDENEGLKLFNFNREQNHIDCIWREPTHRPISCMKFSLTLIDNNPTFYLVTGDRFGNLSIYNNARELSPAPHANFSNLNMVFNTNVGSPVVGTALIDSKEPVASSGRGPLFLYITVTGKIGTVAAFKEFTTFGTHSLSSLEYFISILNKLSVLEALISDEIQNLTSINPLESMSQIIPLASCIDIDIIKKYYSLNPERRQNIVKGMQNRGLLVKDMDFASLDTSIKEIITQAKLMSLR